MKYNVITTLGVSQKFYSSFKTKPLYGRGQRSGVASSEWLFASLPMIKTTEEICKGCTMSSPDGSETWIKHI